MKKLKNRTLAILITGAMLTAVGCSDEESKYTIVGENSDPVEMSTLSESEMEVFANLPYDASKTRTLAKVFGTFSVEQGWVEVEEHSEAPFYFTYVADGTQNNELPDNITVFARKCGYTQADFEKFQQDIQTDLETQATEKTDSVSISKTVLTSEKGYPMVRFDIVRADSVTAQYYILDEHQFVMISAIAHQQGSVEAETTNRVALTMANTFIWSENGVEI